MRVFTIKWFTRWAGKEGIDEAALHAAIADIEAGKVVGGHIIKQRVAKPGAGKSGGWRTLIAIRVEDKAFFVYGFAKNARSNISQHELKTLKAYAKELFGYSEAQLNKALKAGELDEVENNE